MSSSRQLAAIMFTDIVGYTAMMGKDEEKAFELLNKNKQIQKPIIEQYGGLWIKELGDGVLASFSGVSDAVNAAIKIQDARNAAKDLQLRIGIHVGEVLFENDDVFGDGVNIASRIQALAPPGGAHDDGALIAISYKGAADLGSSGHQQFIEGKLHARLNCILRRIAKLHILPIAG